MFWYSSKICQKKETSNYGENIMASLLPSTSSRQVQWLRCFHCGDVMTGRGIDQIFGPVCSSDSNEGYARDTQTYIHLAEEKQGTTISKPVDHSYIWGDAFHVWDHLNPEFKVVNLEIAITLHDRLINKRAFTTECILRMCMSCQRPVSITVA